MKGFTTHRLFSILYTLGLFAFSNHALASAFQLFEQDGSSVGNYHGGYAAKADDASASFYNPAGIVRIKNQQGIFGGNAIMPIFRYVGDISVSSINAGKTPITVTAQGGTFAFVPFVHYVAPISDQVYFGFSVDAPFGLKTNYGHNTPLQYAATLSAVTVVDISTVLAMQYGDHFSIGVGPDFQKMSAEFDSVGTMSGMLDTDSINKVNDTAYGWHGGVLYQFTPGIRAGLSYHSQVVHHLSGSSKFIGPLANLFNGDIPINTKRSTSNVTLPAYTALSLYSEVNPCFALMGSVIYTQWSVFKQLIFNGMAGLDLPGPVASTGIHVEVPEYFRNTWNFSLGADYHTTENVILRAGLGYDQTPVLNAYRNVHLPDNNHYVIALGGHYQVSKAVGVDLSWLHVFIQKAYLNPPPQVRGAQTVQTKGYVNGGADLIGGQVVWNMT